jgi:hypothetical protein
MVALDESSLLIVLDTSAKVLGLGVVVLDVLEKQSGTFALLYSIVA